MRHGDEFMLSDSGITVGSRAMQMIGVEDESECWGLWVEGQRQHDPNRRLHHDLVLSPIHPEFWTSAFHLQLFLHDHRGVAAKVGQILAETGVNVLSANCVHSGFSQFTYSAVCQSTALTDFAMTIRTPTADSGSAGSPLCRDSVVDARQSLQEARFRRIGVRAFIEVSRIWAYLRFLDSKGYDSNRAGENNHFLHHRAVETGPQPFYVTWSSLRDAAHTDPDFAPAVEGLRQQIQRLMPQLANRRHARTYRLTEEALEAALQGTRFETPLESVLHTTWRRHWMEPVVVRALLPLAYQRLWASGEPMRFTYSDRDLLLCPSMHPDYFQQYESLLSTRTDKKIPLIGTASFHKTDRFVRVRILPGSDSRRVITLAADYSAKRDSSPSIPPMSNAGPTEPLTKGLLAAMSQAATSSKMDILRIANSTRSASRDAESGRVTISCLGSPDPGFSVDKVKGQLDTSLQEFAAERKGHSISFTAKPTVEPRGFPNLFFSIKSQSHAQFITRARAIALKNEFSIGTVLTSYEWVKKQVLTAMRSSYAMVQVILPPSGRKTDLQWLHYELGLADMLGIRVIILKATGTPKDIMAMRKGSVTPSFDVNKPGDFEEKLDAALEELRGNMRSRTYTRRGRSAEGGHS